MPRFAALSFFCFLLFILLTSFVYLGSLTAVDRQTLDFLQNNIPPTFDIPLSVFSVLGSAEIVSVIVLILFVSFKLLRNIFTLVGYALTGVIELTIKTSLEQVGPPIEALKTYSFFKLPTSFIPHDFFSYPSGHSARTAFISLLILVLITREKRLEKSMKYFLIIVLTVFDLLMFLSRVYLGEHWASDVLGGVLLGFFLAFLVLFLSLRFSKAHT